MTIEQNIEYMTRKLYENLEINNSTQNIINPIRSYSIESAIATERNYMNYTELGFKIREGKSVIKTIGSLVSAFC